MKKKTIYCKNCGKPREITTNNWRQVTLCKECYYDSKRKQNSEYVRKWREKNKRKKHGKKER